MSFSYRYRKPTSLVALTALIFASTVAPAAADYHPELGRFIQRDPNGTGLVLTPGLRYHGDNPTVTVSLAYQLQFGDGMNFYQYLRSNSLNNTDPSGLFSFPELLSTISTSAYIRATGFAAAHPTVMTFAGGLLAGINIYGFIKYQEVQAVVLAQPNPLGFLTGEAVMLRLAARDVLSKAGALTGLRTASASTQQLATRAAQTTQGLANTGSEGGLYIIPGGQYSASERKAAKYVASLGRDVVLRPPAGTRAAGGTSDLLVGGQPYDVYTPTGSSPSSIVNKIARKKSQAVGVVVDLSQTTVRMHELGDVIARLKGKGVTTIQEVLFVPK